MALHCRVELNKSGGITIKVLGGAGQIIHMDGNKITTTCGASTIEQTPESVTVKCNRFTVEANTITMKSLAGGGSMSLDSNINLEGQLVQVDSNVFEVDTPRSNIVLGQDVYEATYTSARS